jgi:hypothetical protein
MPRPRKRASQTNRAPRARGARQTDHDGQTVHDHDDKRQGGPVEPASDRNHNGNGDGDGDGDGDCDGERMRARILRNNVLSLAGTIPGSEEEMRFAVRLQELARDGAAARSVAGDIAREIMRTAAELIAEAIQLRRQAARLREQAANLRSAMSGGPPALRKKSALRKKPAGRRKGASKR